MHDEPHLNYLQLLPNELIYQLEEICRHPNNSTIGFFEYLVKYGSFLSEQEDFSSCFITIFDQSLQNPESRLTRNFILHGLKQLLRKQITSLNELESRVELTRTYLSPKDYEYRLTLIIHAILNNDHLTLSRQLHDILMSLTLHDISLTITSITLLFLHAGQLLSQENTNDLINRLRERLFEHHQNMHIESYMHSFPSITCDQLVHCSLAFDKPHELEQFIQHLLTSISALGTATNSFTINFFEVKDELRKRLGMLKNILYSHSGEILSSATLQDIFSHLISVPGWNRHYIATIHECLAIILMKLPPELALSLIKNQLIAKIMEEQFISVGSGSDEFIQLICQRLEADFIQQQLVLPINKKLKNMAPNPRIFSYYSLLKHMLTTIQKSISPHLTDIVKAEETKAPPRNNEKTLSLQDYEATTQALINTTDELEYHKLFDQLFDMIHRCYSSHKLRHKEYDKLLQLCMSKGSLNDVDFSEYMDSLAPVCTPALFIKLHLQPYWNNRPKDWMNVPHFDIHRQIATVSDASETVAFMKSALNDLLNELAQGQHNLTSSETVKFLLLLSCRIDPETLQHDYLSRIPEPFQMVIQSLIAIKRQGEILANAAQLSPTTLALD
jgi:hypothetical protein